MSAAAATLCFAIALGALGCHAPVAAQSPGPNAPSQPVVVAVPPSQANRDERAAHDGPPWVLGANVPPFGCAGVSSDGRLAACVVGQVGTGSSDDGVSLAFVSLGAGDDAPAPIDLWVPDGRMAGSAPEQIPLADSARSAATLALKGFIVLQPTATMDWADGATYEGRGMELVQTKQAASQGGENQAPTYDASLLLREAGQSLVVDEQSSRPLSSYVVRVYDLPAGLLVERTLFEADEGWYVTRGQAWLCAGGACRDVQ